MIDFLIASFTSPEQILPNPQSMLWLLPLAAAIAAVYKATKLPQITVRLFLKETTLLFLFIIAFLITAALALFALTWLISI